MLTKMNVEIMSLLLRPNYSTFKILCYYLINYSFLFPSARFGYTNHCNRLPTVNNGQKK